MGRREEWERELKKMNATESTEDTEGKKLGALGGKDNYWEGGDR